MIKNLAIAIDFFRNLRFFYKNPEFKSLKRDIFLAILQNATVSISYDIPEVLCVELAGKKLFEIEKCDVMFSATIFQKVDEYPTIKEMRVLSLIYQKDANITVTDYTVKNRIYPDTKRIQVLKNRETQLYDVSGRLLDHKFYPQMTKSADVSTEFLQSDVCTKLSKVVMIEDLGMRLTYKPKGEKPVC